MRVIRIKTVVQLSVGCRSRGCADDPGSRRILAFQDVELRLEQRGDPKLAVKTRQQEPKAR